MPVIFSRGDKLENGHYTVVKELGVGGMGIVYHCRDEQLMRDVAIKMLLPELMADKANVEIFQQEARLAAQLEHPNIVTVYHIGMEERQRKPHHYVAMEYLPGGNLANRVISGPLAVEHCLNWMKQLASGLTFAHKRGVVHQDIKADNIFITNEGDLKIGDFGLARLLVGRVHYNSSTKGMGTPAYMSPELCRGEPQDHRSDIYSLGVLFFEMATGQLPFRARGMIEMATKHSSAPIPSAKRINPLIPEILDKVIRRMMAKTPDERYSSMSEVLTILDDLIFELRVARLGLGNRPLLRTGAMPTDPAAQAPQARTDSEHVTPEPSWTKTSDAMRRTLRREESPIDTNSLPPVDPALQATAEAKAELAKQQHGRQSMLQSEQLIAQLEDAEKEKAITEEKPAARPKGHFVQTQQVKPTPLERMRSSQDMAARQQMPEQAPKQFQQLATSHVPEARAKDVTAHPPESKTTQAPPKEPPVKIPVVPAAGKKPEPPPVVAKPALAETPRRISGPTPRVPSVPIVQTLRSGIELDWSYKSEGPIGWSSAPVVDKEERFVYIASCDGSTTALDLANGAQLWKHRSDSPILASPTLVGDKLVVTSSDGTVAALHVRNGQGVWKFQADDKLVATPAQLKDILFVPTAKGRLLAIDAASGALRWQYKADDAIVSSPQRHGEYIVFGTRGGYVHCVTIDGGKVRWKFHAGSPIVSSLSASVDSLYFGAQDGTFYALEAETGGLIWEYPTDNPIVSRGIISFTNVVFASQDKWLYCCEKYDGSLKWKGAVRGKVVANLVLARDMILSASREGWLQAFAPRSGELKWQLELKRCLESPPVVSSEKLLLGTVEGELLVYTFASESTLSEKTA
jgi:serine/threonine protein kinase/outer membrane protein assembly factor BamB